MTGHEREYQRCVRTIMDTTDPDITFDSRGVSSHALNYDVAFAPIVDKAQSGQALPELASLDEEVEEIRRGFEFDMLDTRGQRLEPAAVGQ